MCQALSEALGEKADETIPRFLGLLLPSANSQTNQLSNLPYHFQPCFYSVRFLMAL